jgi:hypothetical protein
MSSIARNIFLDKMLTLKNVLVLKIQAQFKAKSTFKTFFMPWKVVSNVLCT